MVKLTVLLSLGFKRAYEKASNWLRKTPWSSLFLELPIESEPFIYAFTAEKVDEEEFWSNFTLLTGFSEPFINSLKLRFHPVLNCIKDTYADDKEIHCYQDLKWYINEKKILEKILLLELRCMLTKKIDLKEWKNTLLQEKKIIEDSWGLAVDRILEETHREYTENIILYGGYLKSIKHLRRPDIKVEIILLEDYWKSPLDILRTILWKYGFNNISDKKIERYLKLQKMYLDLIINSKDIDEAHEAWTKIVKSRVREL